MAALNWVRSLQAMKSMPKRLHLLSRYSITKRSIALAQAVLLTSVFVLPGFNQSAEAFHPEQELAKVVASSPTDIFMFLGQALESLQEQESLSVKLAKNLDQLLFRQDLSFLVKGVEAAAPASVQLLSESAIVTPETSSLVSKPSKTDAELLTAVFGESSLDTELASRTESSHTQLNAAGFAESFTPPEVNVNQLYQQAFNAGFDAAKAEEPTKVKAGIETVQNAFELIQGKSEILQLNRPAKRIALSNPSVASANVISPFQVQLIGLTTGTTNLLVWEEGPDSAYKTYDISVRRDVSLLEEQIKQVAPDVKVTPLVARDTVILTGEVASMDRANLVLELANAFFSQLDAAVTNGDQANGANPGTQNNQNVANQNSGNSTVSSLAPGSSIGGARTNVINLIKVQGLPSTKLELVQSKLTEIHPEIKIDLAPSATGEEKVILTGRVPFTGYIAKAINLAAVFYGEPGLRILSGPGGNGVRENPGDEDFQDAEAFSDNLDINLLQGVVVSDTSGNVVSLIEVDQKPQVRATIKFLDVTKNDTNALGTRFANLLTNRFQIGNDLTPSGIDDSGIGLPRGRNLFSEASNTGGGTLGILSGELDVVLQALEEKQVVRSLAEPTIMTLSGEKASFLAGGEIPIPISDANGRITLEYREFGIRLNMIPTVTDEGKIQLQVAPEVSSIDASNSFQSTLINIPGIATRRLQTTVELEPGQSFVIGGLYSTEDSEAVSRIPVIGNLPIIGSFFRSNLRDKTDSEIVVIIKPEIMTSDSIAQPSTADVYNRSADFKASQLPRPLKQTEEKVEFSLPEAVVNPQLSRKDP